jgi:flagellin
MNSEYSQLAQEIDRIAGSTTFNGIALLNSTSAYKIHVGSTDTINVSAQKMTSSALGVKVGLGADSTYINTRGVARADDNYLAAAEVANGNDHFNFTFTNSAASATKTALTVDLSAYDGTNVSLNTLVNAINTAWTGASHTGTVAYAQFSDATQQYQLELKNTTAGASHLSVSAANVAIGAAANQFTSPTHGTSGTALTLTTTSGATAALAVLTSAIGKKDAYRAQLGYLMNRLQSASSVIDIQTENLKAANSRITDVDVATEMAKMTESQVLSQAGISMLTQANTMPQMALQLLKG